MASTIAISFSRTSFETILSTLFTSSKSISSSAGEGAGFWAGAGVGAGVGAGGLAGVFSVRTGVGAGEVAGDFAGGAGVEVGELAGFFVVWMGVEAGDVAGIALVGVPVVVVVGAMLGNAPSIISILSLVILYFETLVFKETTIYYYILEYLTSFFTKGVLSRIRTPKVPPTGLLVPSFKI